MERKLEVESSDVIKLIIQFLKENGLLASVRALQEESKVTLNTVDDVEKFSQDIVHGRWDAVLDVLSTLRLPASRLIDLYEQIVLELAELRELDTARALLRYTPAMNKLKRDAPDRYLRLEHIIQRTYFDHAEAYPGGTNKERRRQTIAQALKQEVMVVPPARLMALLNQALKWQSHIGGLPKGTQFDLFRGGAPATAMEDEKFPTRNHKVIKFGKKSHPESACFSPDGQFLVSGSLDGFIEVWDYDSGKLCKELKYQAEDDFMMHDQAVISLTFSRNSELLASGCNDGSIKVWRIRTGSCVRRFENSHTAGVSCLEFSRDGTQVLSGSFDNTAKIHGLKSGRSLKEFRGHSSYVNTATYSEDGEQIITGSSDGFIKVWDVKTTDCVKTFKPTQGQTDISIIGLLRLPRHVDRLLIANRAPSMQITNTSGEIIANFTIPNGAAITGYCVSPKANYTYAVTEDKVLYSFNTESARVEHVIKLHKKEVLGVAHHPHRNVFASWSQDGTLKIWRP